MVSLDNIITGTIAIVLGTLIITVFPGMFRSFTTVFVDGKPLTGGWVSNTRGSRTAVDRFGRFKISYCWRDGSELDFYDSNVNHCGRGTLHKNHLEEFEPIYLCTIPCREIPSGGKEFPDGAEGLPAGKARLQNGNRTFPADKPARIAGK